MTTLRTPSEAEFKNAIDAYGNQESRGPVYFQALEKINNGWGDAARMADGVGLLLKSWHNTFYRFGPFDAACLTSTIESQLPTLTGLRTRTIDSFDSEDESIVRQLFAGLTNATKGGKNGTQESTVATAKALHLLLPAFMPLWDNAIAGAYGQFPMLSRNYVAFGQQMRELAKELRNYLPNPDDRTVLKRLDEFNYSVYTKRWIKLRQA